jgi:co-chaperonin GroES (HSP10)
MKVQGKIKPLKDKVFVSNMEFGMERTTSGLYIPSADGKTQGIMPRWGQVWAIGDEQTDVSIGDWVCVEHGRWTRTIEYKNEDGSITEVRMVDAEAIMMVSDEKPNDVYRSIA